MKITTWPRRSAMGTAVAAIAATGLIAGATALVSPLGAGHASLRLRQVAAQSAPVTTTMKGPISATAVPLLQGPSSGYPVTGHAQAFTPYAVTCFSTPEVAAGGSGPYSITDMSSVWYKLTDTVTSQDIGYIQATNPANQFSIDSSAVPDAVGRCASDPSPPVPQVSANGEAIGAAQPFLCARGTPMTDGSTTTITVHSSSGHLDVEFDAALWPMSVDVQDLSTGQSGSGYALADQKATWHFTEDQQTTFGDHTLMITVDGALGGPVANLENPGAPPNNGDNAVGDVSWENMSDNCVP